MQRAKWRGRIFGFTLGNVQQFEQDNAPQGAEDFVAEADEAMMAATNVTAVPLEGEAPKTTSLKTQIIRFIITGCLSAVVDFGLLLLLSHFGMDPTLAKGISFICGTTTAYMINRRWTFQAAHSNKRLLAVCLLYAVTFGLNVGIFHVVYEATLSLGHLWAKAIGFVVGQAVATIVNFVVQRTVIFRVR